MTREETYRVAAEANCDPRTVKTYVEGGNMKPVVKERIAAAIKKLKLKVPRTSK
jgi:DNA-binding LacI/PurR family transcriptional regulator